MNNEIEKSDSMPWDKLPNESENKYHAFCVYIDLGSKRSYPQVAKILSLSRVTIFKYSKEFDWPRRAALYDSYAYEKNKADFLELVEERNFQRYERKIGFSSTLQNMIDCLTPYLQRYWECYGNDEIMKKAEFILKLSRIINEIDKMSDFSLNTKLLNDKSLRDFNILNIVQKYTGVQPSEMNESAKLNLILENVLNKAISPPNIVKDNYELPKHIEGDLRNPMPNEYFDKLHAGYFDGPFNEYGEDISDNDKAEKSD